MIKDGIIVNGVVYELVSDMRAMHCQDCELEEMCTSELPEEIDLCHLFPWPKQSLLLFGCRFRKADNQ